MNNKPHREFIAVIIDLVVNLFKRFSKLFDRIIYDGKGSLLISLLLSIFICVAIDYDTIRIRLFNDTTTTVTISDVKVEALYDADKFEIVGIPATVDVTITGQATDIQVYRQQDSMNVIADLRNYSDGENIVDLVIEGLPQSLSAKVNPSSVNVQIDKKIMKKYSVVPELLVGNGQKVSDYDTPTLEISTVEITGTSAKLESIRVVKALIDTTGQISDFSTNAVIVAYDATGHALDVDISPATVVAHVKLIQVNEVETKGEE